MVKYKQVLFLAKSEQAHGRDLSTRPHVSIIQHIKENPTVRWGCSSQYLHTNRVERISQVDSISRLFPTTVTTGVNKVNSTVTTVPSKGENYLKIDALYDSLGDLVNERFRAWYCQQFQVLGRDTVLICAAIARQESRSDKRKYFSYLLKNYKPRD